jgi:hypothetical protein
MPLGDDAVTAALVVNEVEPPVDRRGDNGFAVGQGRTGRGAP